MSDTADLVASHWATTLGIETAALLEPGVFVSVQPGARSWNGVMCFVRGETAVVSCPADLAKRLRRRLTARDPDSLLDPDVTVRIVGADIERVTGPAYQGYLEPEAFRPFCNPRVRRLSGIPSADGDAVGLLRGACTPLEWEHAGIDPAGVMWGVFAGSQLLALAQLRSSRPGLGDPCVLTHPNARGQGLGAAVASAVVESAVREGRVVTYQTLMSNTPAVKIATKLGFTRYAQTLALRLRAPRRSPEPPPEGIGRDRG